MIPCTAARAAGGQGWIIMSVSEALHFSGVIDIAGRIRW